MITFGQGNLRIPRFEEPVYVVAGGLTDFRKRYPDKSTEELVVEAVQKMLRNDDVMRSDRLKQVMQSIDPNFDDLQPLPVVLVVDGRQSRHDAPHMGPAPAVCERGSHRSTPRSPRRRSTRRAEPRAG